MLPGGVEHDARAMWCPTDVVGAVVREIVGPVHRAGVPHVLACPLDVVPRAAVGPDPRDVGVVVNDELLDAAERPTGTVRRRAAIHVHELTILARVRAKLAA